MSEATNTTAVQAISNQEKPALKAYSDMTTRELLAEVNWVSAVFLVVTPLLSLILLPLYISNHGWSWGLTAFLVILYTISNMSITVCYHRYFAHRSFDVPPWVQFLFLLVGSMAFQGSVLRWATDHRRHHLEVDTDEDPYSINKGFFFAHLGWMLMRDRHPDVDVMAKDLEKQKWVKFQHDHYVWIAIATGFILPGLIGMLCGFGFWPGLLIGGLTRIVLSQHSTFLINSAAHTFGRQPYNDKNTARDSFTMAVLTFGEGYHNYHHFFQADYRNGIRWYQWDPTKWFISIMAVVGLAKRLKKASAEEIQKARMAMDAKRILERGASHERIQALREQWQAAQRRWKEVHAEIQRYKAEFKRFKAAQRAAIGERLHALQVHLQEWQDRLREKQAELELARVEMNNALRAWETYVRAWLRAQPA